MAERQVTVDGVTRPLPRPFLLLATENPIEHEGTFFLPEAQLDRFLIRTALSYPAREQELQVVLDQVHGHPLGQLEPAVGLRELLELQAALEEVFVHALIRGWIVDLVRATRGLEIVALGASVRGSLALERTARAQAVVHGRDYVVPEDVEAAFVPTIAHRLLFTPDFLATVRTQEREKVLQTLWERCLEAAPRPAPG
jgi:MoxR-like ATPase